MKELNCELRIVGQPNDSQRQALVRNSIEYSQVVGLSESDLLEEYRRCDIVSFVSTSEGFGMPILEANACGRVVITGNCTSMPEVAGDAGCLVDPFSFQSIRHGIERLIRDEAYREDLIQRGFLNVRRFHPNRIAQRYLDVYLDLQQSAKH